MISFVVVGLVISKLHFTNEFVVKQVVNGNILEFIKLVDVFDVDDFEIWDVFKADVGVKQLVNALGHHSSPHKIFHFLETENELMAFEDSFYLVNYQTIQNQEEVHIQKFSTCKVVLPDVCIVE